MRSRATFDFFDTEAAALRYIESWNARMSPYMRKHHPPHFTPWQSQDGREQKIVVWHHEFC